MYFYTFNNLSWYFKRFIFFCLCVFLKVGFSLEERVSGDRGSHPEFGDHQNQGCRSHQQLSVWSAAMGCRGLCHSPTSKHTSFLCICFGRNIFENHLLNLYQNLCFFVFDNGYSYKYWHDTHLLLRIWTLGVSNMLIMLHNKTSIFGFLNISSVLN